MKNVVAFFLLAIPFSLTAIAAAPVMLVAAWRYESSPYAKNLLRTADRLGAAFLGLGDGTRTVSAECGRSQCRMCMLICKLLDWVQPGHCKGAADREFKE